MVVICTCGWSFVPVGVLMVVMCTCGDVDGGLCTCGGVDGGHVYLWGC